MWINSETGNRMVHGDLRRRSSLFLRWGKARMSGVGATLARFRLCFHFAFHLERFTARTRSTARRNTVSDDDPREFETVALTVLASQRHPLRRSEGHHPFHYLGHPIDQIPVISFRGWRRRNNIDHEGGLLLEHRKKA